MSDYIPDVTKMIGETPRTDEQEHFIDSDRGVVDSGLARELERELNAANQISKKYEDRYFECLERIKRLIAERDTARRQADQQYNLREEFRELLGTDDVEQGVAVVREMKERIKRLEEAGNNLLCTFCTEYISDFTKDQSNALKQWNKAKDGSANAAVAEAAERLAEQHMRIKRLEEAGDELEADKQTLLGLLHQMGAKAERLGSVGVGSTKRWHQAKEAKP